MIAAWGNFRERVGKIHSNICSDGPKLGLTYMLVNLGIAHGCVAIDVAVKWSVLSRPY
jgi:hypothetical protein